MNLKKIILYTDGACSGNPGPGGWAALLQYRLHIKEICGFETNTTNNRMELTAVIEGLSALKEHCRVAVYSDSAYVVNAFEKGWLQNWLANGWRKTDKSSVENQDLWLQLLVQTEKHTVTFHKVAGHADNEKNNRCDKLARDQITQHVNALSDEFLASQRENRES